MIDAHQKSGGRKPGCPGVYYHHTKFSPILWYKYIYVCPAIPATRKVTVTTLTQCVACPANSHSEEGSGHITKCVCNIGWLGYDGVPCEQCPLGKYTVFISNWEAECNNCPAGQYSPVLGIGITSCQNCMKGTYSTADAAMCTSCPTNSDSFEASTVQSACICNAGSTGSDGEACSECARGKFKLYNGSAACEECPPETFQARSGTTHCTQCRANSYSLQGSTAALSCTCNAGYSTLNESVLCQRCEAGKYNALSSLDPHSSKCSDCPVAKYSSLLAATSCQDCPEYSYSPAASTARIQCQCNAGASGMNGGPCLQCASTNIGECECSAGSTGIYDGTSPCTQCVAGKYSITTGSTVCVSCSAGQYSTEIGAGYNTCQECPKNSISAVASNNNTSCICKPGSLGPNGGPCIYSDIPCLPGTTRTGETCSLCVPGKYKSTSSDEACTSCPFPSGSTTLIGNISETACQCRAGWFGQTSEECQPCAAGKYKSSMGYGSCTVCPFDLISSSGSAFCTCAHTLAQPDSNSKCACDVGFYGLDINGTCHLCDVGTYNDIIGAETCKSCRNNATSVIGSTTAQSCTACLPGSEVDRVLYQVRVGSTRCHVDTHGNYHEIAQMNINSSVYKQTYIKELLFDTTSRIRILHFHCACPFQ